MTFEELTSFEQGDDTEAEILLSRLYHPGLSTQHRLFERLPVPQQHLLKALERQSERWSHKVYFKDNLLDRRIALLNGYHKAQRLVNCMMSRSPYSNSKAFARCGLRDCPFCSYLKGQDMLKKYLPAWEQDVWHEFVFSIRGGVPLSTFSRYGGPGLPEIWDTMRSCIRDFAPACDGIIGWEELWVFTFLPALLLTPHLQLLVHCIDAPDTKRLVNIIAEHWHRKKLICTPDCRFAPVKSEAHFCEILQYVKPVDFFTPYNTAYRQAKTPADVEALHHEVREFFEAYAQQTSLDQVRWSRRLRAHYHSAVTRCPYFYFGDCHGGSRSPVGLDLKTRRTAEHQEIIRARKQDAQEKEAADAEDVNQQQQTDAQPQRDL